jgi:hypothetical protein
VFNIDHIDAPDWKQPAAPIPYSQDKLIVRSSTCRFATPMALIERNLLSHHRLSCSDSLWSNSAS